MAEIIAGAIFTALAVLLWPLPFWRFFCAQWLIVGFAYALALTHTP